MENAAWPNQPGEPPDRLQALRRLSHGPPKTCYPKAPTASSPTISTNSPLGPRHGTSPFVQAHFGIGIDYFWTGPSGRLYSFLQPLDFHGLNFALNIGRRIRRNNTQVGFQVISSCRSCRSAWFCGASSASGSGHPGTGVLEPPARGAPLLGLSVPVRGSATACDWAAGRGLGGAAWPVAGHLQGQCAGLRAGLGAGAAVSASAPDSQRHAGSGSAEVQGSELGVSGFTAVAQASVVGHGDPAGHPVLLVEISVDPTKFEGPATGRALDAGRGGRGFARDSGCWGSTASHRRFGFARCGAEWRRP